MREIINDFLLISAMLFGLLCLAGITILFFYLAVTVSLWYFVGVFFMIVTNILTYAYLSE